MAEVEFSAKQFWKFCEHLYIDGKETGIKSLSYKNSLGTQRHFIREVEKGLKEGIHTYIVLKGRQLGLTTISLALDLYWQFKHPGMQGSLVSHTEEGREFFRTNLTTYMDRLPPQYKIPVKAHNRTQLVLKNNSRLTYQVAGTRKNPNLGKGQALTFMHATEVASWGDPEGLASLQASLAQKNPNRLYIYESTAQGFNMFYEMWDSAKAARFQKAIFIGWWLKEDYAFPKGSPQYETYWDGKFTTDEKEWVRSVKKMYGHDITPEQISWWRWMLLEEVRDDMLMFQDFPPTETHAFILSGSNFFSSEKCTDAMKEAKKASFTPYRFVLGENFEDTELKESHERFSNLKIWEYPKDNGHYVIGADPAYGSSEWADRFCVSVWRCYSDGLEQVAEFCTADCNTYQFAWVVCYLAGAYKNTMVNLEINGPGQAVWNEMQNLKRIAATMRDTVSAGIYNVVANIQNYLYKRPDSIGGGFVYHYKTTWDTKERMLNFMKDNFERGMMKVHSEGLLDEMRIIVREDGSIAASGRGKDDRVIAAALAGIAWGDFIRMRLVQAGESRGLAAAREGAKDFKMEAAQSAVAGYLRKIGVS